MALSPRQFVEEVEELYKLIEEKLNKKKTELGLLPSERVRFGQVDFSNIKDKLLEITVALHRLYVTQQSIDNRPVAETLAILKKAKTLSLAGVCETFKNYTVKKDETFWQYFSSQAGIYVNYLFYNKILEPALVDNNIIFPNWNKSDSFNKIIAKESELSPSSTEKVMKIFHTYWKYFHPLDSITDFLIDIEKGEKSYYLNQLPKLYTERENIHQHYEGLSEIKDKIVIVFNDLISFSNYVINKPQLLTLTSLEESITEFGKIYKKDITYLFKTEELKNKFIKIFPSISLSTFISLLKKESDLTQITLPDNSTITIKEFIEKQEFFYGIYTIDTTKYQVLPNQSFDVKHFTSIERDKIFVEGKKIIVRSFHEFIPYIGITESFVKPVKIFRNGNWEGYLWYFNRPSIDTLTIKSEKVPILPLEPQENIISSLNLKLNTDNNEEPIFSLLLDDLFVISNEYKNKKINIINTDQTSIFHEIAIDSEGVGYTGKINYPIKTKKPQRIDLYLVHDNNPIDIKNHSPNITYYLSDSILFDANLKTNISPSKRDMKLSSSKLYLFTTKTFEDKWVSNVCEVNSYNKFGNYNVYEIEWIDKTKPLEININNKYQWHFSKCVELDIEVKKETKENHYINYKENQVLNLKDINLILSSKDNNFSIKDIEVSTYYNFNLISSKNLISSINTLLERNENHGIIDESFIKKLLLSNSDVKYGKYEIVFSYNSIIIGKTKLCIIPKLELLEVNDLFIEQDQVILTLKSDVPCFKNKKTKQNYLFDKLAKCKFTFSNKVVESTVSEYTKSIILHCPYTILELKYRPNVIGYRFIQNNRIYATDLIDFYDLDKTSLALRLNPKYDIRLRVNNNVVKPLTPNRSGIVIEQLDPIKNYMIQPNNDVAIQIGGHELNFKVLWNPKITKFSCNDILLSPENGISFSISYDGPVNSYLKFYLTDDYSRNIEVRKISCGDDHAPKFIRYDMNKNCIFLTCDGKAWENRNFIIHLEPETIKNIQMIRLRGVYDYNNASFGELVFNNENLEPEIHRINQNVKANPENPYLYFERGFLYSEMNEFGMANQDFNKSLELGLDDQEALGYINMFKSSLNINLLSYELGQISHLAQKLYAEELLLDVKTK